MNDKQFVNVEGMAKEQCSEEVKKDKSMSNSDLKRRNKGKFNGKSVTMGLPFPFICILHISMKM